MSVTVLPPPRRFLVECDESEDSPPVLVECTGQEDPCFIVGMENPWLGCSLDEIERYAREGEYGPLSFMVVSQCEQVRKTGK